MEKILKKLKKLLRLIFGRTTLGNAVSADTDSCALCRV